jgi:hypothetical protein
MGPKKVEKPKPPRPNVKQSTECKLICGNCGSTRMSKNPSMSHAVAQRVLEDTNEPIGQPTTLIFRCLSCGEDVYLEKFEVTEER